MLYRLPRVIPPAAVLLADLGNPSAPELARSLGVSVRSIWRWQAADRWPRPALLALFFASRWGWSMVECDARGNVQAWRALADSQRRELAALRSSVDRMARLGPGFYGAANDARGA